MSCGLPVVCSNVCDNPTIVINNENGYLFNPLDANDIAVQIEKIALLTKKQRDEMGTKNRKRIFDICSQSKVSSQYLSLIEV